MKRKSTAASKNIHAENKRRKTKSRRSVDVTGPANPYIPCWRDLNEFDKLKWSCRAAQGANGYAFSLNLSIGREGGFVDRDNAMRGFQKRLSDAFKGQSLPMLPVAVQLEASSGTGRLHMHGVVITDGHDVMKVKRALREAAGYIRGRAGSRQCALRSLTESDGWTGYILKDLAYTDRQTPGRLSYINTPMKQRAQQLHAQSRGKALSANSNEYPLEKALPPTGDDVAAVRDTILEAADQLSEEDDLRMKSNPFYGMF